MVRAFNGIVWRRREGTRDRETKKRGAASIPETKHTCFLDQWRKKRKRNLISITGGAVSMYGVESEVATCRAGMTVRSRLWEEPWREFLGRCLFRDKDPGPAVFGYLLPY